MVFRFNTKNPNWKTQSQKHAGDFLVFIDCNYSGGIGPKWHFVLTIDFWITNMWQNNHPLNLSLFAWTLFDTMHHANWFANCQNTNELKVIYYSKLNQFSFKSQQTIFFNRECGTWARLDWPRRGSGRNVQSCPVQFLIMMMMMIAMRMMRWWSWPRWWYLNLYCEV